MTLALGKPDKQSAKRFYGLGVAIIERYRERLANELCYTFFASHEHLGSQCIHPGSSFHLAWYPVRCWVVTLRPGISNEPCMACESHIVTPESPGSESRQRIDRIDLVLPCCSHVHPAAGGPWPLLLGRTWRCQSPGHSWLDVICMAWASSFDIIWYNPYSIHIPSFNNPHTILRSLPKRPPARSSVWWWWNPSHRSATNPHRPLPMHYGVDCPLSLQISQI